MADIISEQVDIQNPMHLVPSSQKLNFPHQRKREVEILCDKTEPPSGWTHNQIIEFTLNTDVAVLDLKHMMLRAKYSQTLLSEAGQAIGMKYLNSVPQTSDAGKSFSWPTGAGEARVSSLLDLEYGELSIFKTVTIKVNDKVFYKMEDVDKIRKFVHLNTAVEEMPSEFTKFTQGSLATYKNTNFDSPAAASPTWFDVILSFSSLFDEYPLLPIYKMVGTVKIELTLNDSKRAFAPVLTRNKLDPMIKIWKSATSTAQLCTIKWTADPTASFHISEPRLQFYSLEFMDDSAKDFDDISSHFLLPTINYREFVQGTASHTIDFGLKMPSVRYVFHSLVNRTAETTIVPKDITFTIASLYVHKMIAAETQIRHFKYTPHLAVAQGLNAYAISSAFTLPLDNCYANIGNLRYPSDRRYDGNLDMFLQKGVEFYGYNAKNMFSTKPMITFKGKDGNYGQINLRPVVDLVEIAAAAELRIFETILDESIASGESDYDEKPMNYRLLQRFTQPRIEIDDTQVWNTGTALLTKQGQAAYFWNFSKMVQKGKAITGDLNTQFNNAYFIYNLKKEISTVTNTSGIVYDLKWMQFTFSDAKEVINAANGNMELFI